jgi:hypothetical protein
MHLFETKLQTELAAVNRYIFKVSYFNNFFSRTAREVVGASK